MIEGLELELAGWLGDAKSLGAQSWIQALSWVAALFLAVFAWIAIRRQSLQSRALLLLSLYVQWESLSKPRKWFSNFCREIRTNSQLENAHLKFIEQQIRLRSVYSTKMTELRQQNSEEFHGFVDYISFFEIVGTYVRNGYIPMRDIDLLYKGPLLDLEIVARDFIGDWQKEAHMPDGLLENALYLMNSMRTKQERPIYYRTLYPFTTRIMAAITWVRGHLR